MKSLYFALMLLITLPAWANKTGLGISLGNPTGLNGKYWLNSGHAIDAGMAWSIGRTHFTIHSDYLLHSEGAFYFQDVYSLDLYYGIGGRMAFSDDIELGVRLPVGLVHKLERETADIFGEVAPILDFIGRTGVDLHVLFGGRYYF